VKNGGNDEIEKASTFQSNHGNLTSNSFYLQCLPTIGEVVLLYVKRVNLLILNSSLVNPLPKQ